MNKDSNSDDEIIAKLIAAAKNQRGGKPAKYMHLDKYPEIIKLVESDVQLPFILKWLQDEKKETLVLNTLRKYVISKIGREKYELFLKRNGWMRTKQAKPNVGKEPPSPGTDNQVVETRTENNTETIADVFTKQMEREKAEREKAQTTIPIIDRR